MMKNKAQLTANSRKNPVNLALSWQTSYLLMDRILTLLSFLLLGLTLLPLLLVIFYVTLRGLGRLDWGLLTQLPPPPLVEGGGIGPALQGTLILVGLASLISIPTGLLAGIYLAEFSRGQLQKGIRLAVNILSGVPSILVGVFAYAIIVVPTGTFSTWAGALALAILMLPLIIRTTDEALQLIPQEIRWASASVGSSDFQTVGQIILPIALPSILTGITLSLARAAGETAPLIFTALFSFYWMNSLSQPISSMAVLIYNYATVPYSNQQELAWAASLVIVVLVLLSSLLSRWVIRSQT